MIFIYLATPCKTEKSLGGLFRAFFFFIIIILPLAINFSDLFY